MFCNSLACLLHTLEYISRISVERLSFVWILHTNCFYITLCIELWLWISADRQIRRSPRNQLLPARYVGIRWRSPPQHLVAISSATRALSKPSRFRRNVLRAGRAWEQLASIVFIFQAPLVKVNPFIYLMAYSNFEGNQLNSMSSNTGQLAVSETSDTIRMCN